MRLLGLLFVAFLAGVVPAATAPALPVTTIAIDTPHGPKAFRVELATDQASQELGLMYRTKLAPDAGMLFEFQPPQAVTFWMKNTILPLDLVFIRADGTVSSIAANAVPYSLDAIPSSEPVRAVLEIRGGRAQALGIVPSAHVHGAIFHNALPEKMRR